MNDSNKNEKPRSVRASRSLTGAEEGTAEANLLVIRNAFAQFDPEVDGLNTVDVMDEALEELAILRGLRK